MRNDGQGLWRDGKYNKGSECRYDLCANPVRCWKGQFCGRPSASGAMNMDDELLGAMIATYRTSRIQAVVLITMAVLFAGLSAWMLAWDKILELPSRWCAFPHHSIS
jgi:hypothetical protein